MFCVAPLMIWLCRLIQLVAVMRGTQLANHILAQEVRGPGRKREGGRIAWPSAARRATASDGNNVGEYKTPDALGLAHVSVGARSYDDAGRRF